MVDTAKKKRHVKKYQDVFKNVASPNTKRAFNNAKNINTRYKLIHGTKVKDPNTNRKYVLHGEKGRQLTMGSKPTTKITLTKAQKADYINKHGDSFFEMGTNDMRKRYKTLQRVGNSGVDYMYDLISKTKVVDPKTKRNYVRHGPKGQKIIKNTLVATYKQLLNNGKVPNGNKAQYLNRLFSRFGVKNTMNRIGGTKVEAYRSRGINYVPSGRLYKTDEIRKELANLTNGQVSLGGRTKTLGEGVSGLAVTCVSNTKCKKEYKDLVLKISAADKEWENEVKFLTKITKWMDKNPKEDPLAPRIIGSFQIDKRGFILMQNATKVYDDVVSAKEWKQYGSLQAKFKFLPAIKEAMKQLHKIGIMHGNMHHGNVWIAIVKNKSKLVPKAYFADFGRSHNYNNAKKLKPEGRNWRYGYMMTKSIPLQYNPDARVSLMNDNMVMKEYEAAAIKR